MRSFHPLYSLLLHSLLLLIGIGASFVASSGPIQWMDNGVFLADAAMGQYFSTTLEPLSHPLYQLLTTTLHELFGAEVLSYANSLLLIPLALLIVAICRALAVDTSVGLLAAIAAVLSHGLFWVSTKAEIYLLHTVILLAVYLLYLRAEDGGDGKHSRANLFWIGVLTGLAATVHQLTFVVLLPLYVSLLARNKVWLLLTVPGFLIGFLPAYPALVNDLQAGRGFVEIFRTFLTGAVPTEHLPGWESSLFRFDLIVQEQNAVLVLLLSLLGPQLLGLVVPQVAGKLRVLWWSALVNFAFALSYNVSDRFTFFLPGLVLAAILGCVFLKGKLPETRAGAVALTVSTLCTPLALLTVFVLSSQGVINLPRHSVSLPFRDDVKYFLLPYLRDRSAEAFVAEYERQIPPGAVVLADWTPLGALRSAQANGRFLGRSLHSCDSRSGDSGGDLNAGPVFLVRTDYCGTVAERFQLTATPLGYAVTVKAPEPN